jgi:hypothetical protein
MSVESIIDNLLNNEDIDDETFDKLAVMPETHALINYLEVRPEMNWDIERMARIFAENMDTINREGIDGLLRIIGEKITRDDETEEKLYVCVDRDIPIYMYKSDNKYLFDKKGKDLLDYARLALFPLVETSLKKN